MAQATAKQSQELLMQVSYVLVLYVHTRYIYTRCVRNAYLYEGSYVRTYFLMVYEVGFFCLRLRLFIFISSYSYLLVLVLNSTFFFRARLINFLSSILPTGHIYVFFIQAPGIFLFCSFFSLFFARAGRGGWEPKNRRKTRRAPETSAPVNGRNWSNP